MNCSLFLGRKARCDDANSKCMLSCIYVCTCIHTNTQVRHTHIRLYVIHTFICVWVYRYIQQRCDIQVVGHTHVYTHNFYICT